MVHRLVALLAVMAIVGTACSAKSERTVIQFQASGDAPELGAFQTLIDAFEDANPDISVELVGIASSGDHMAKLAASFATGDQPDIFLVNYRRFGQLARNGAIDPIGPLFDDGTIDKEDFYDVAINAFTVDGVLQCGPQNVSSPVIYFNTELFADAGIEPPNEGWTWSEFVNIAKKLTLDKDGDGKTDVYGFGVQPELVRLAPFVWMAGGEVVDDTEVPTKTTLLGAPAVEAMQWFLDLQRKHKVSPAQEEAAAEEFDEGFSEGRIAMYMDSRKEVPAFRAVDDLQWDVLPLPKGKVQASVLHSDAYCIASGSEKKDAARKFVTYALSREGETVLAKTGRTVPSLRSVAVSDAYFAPGEKPEHAGVWLDALSYMRVLPNIAAWNEIESKADPIVEEWYYSKEPAEALGIEIDLATRALFAPSAGP